MNNFGALNYERSSLDHGVWFMVVGFMEKMRRNELFDLKYISVK